MFETIGRYRIQAKLGQGAVAEVFKAYDPSIDRTLAIKLLREQRCSDPEYRARLLRESKAAGILSHANIATVYDVGEVGERPYIVMEYLERDPLDEVMRSGEAFSLEKIVTYGIQLSKALAYAHQRGIVHRDVKPGNIVRMKNSNTIKVMDFGIAQMENKDATQQPRRARSWAPPSTCRPSRCWGRPWTPGRTSSPWGASSTRSSPAGSPSTPTRSGRCSFASPPRAPGPSPSSPPTCPPRSSAWWKSSSPRSRRSATRAARK